VAVSILAMSVQSKKTRGARKPTGGSCAIAMTSVVQARARGKRVVRMPTNAPRSRLGVRADLLPEALARWAQRVLVDGQPVHV
jgi:hypothetical protein